MNCRSSNDYVYDYHKPRIIWVGGWHIQCNFCMCCFWLVKCLHTRLTIWNWKNFQNHWCHHKSLISLARSWQIGSPHPCYSKNWTNDVCFRSEGTKENTLDNFFTSEDIWFKSTWSSLENKVFLKKTWGNNLKVLLVFCCSIDT